MILPQHVLGVLVGALEQDSYFSISWEFHHELHHFSEVWRKTTNQCLIYEYSEFANLPSSYSGSWICSVFLQVSWIRRCWLSKTGQLKIQASGPTWIC